MHIADETGYESGVTITRRRPSREAIRVILVSEPSQHSIARTSAHKMHDRHVLLLRVLCDILFCRRCFLTDPMSKSQSTASMRVTLTWLSLQ